MPRTVQLLVVYNRLQWWGMSKTKINWKWVVQHFYESWVIRGSHLSPLLKKHKQTGRASGADWDGQTKQTRSSKQRSSIVLFAVFCYPSYHWELERARDQSYCLQFEVLLPSLHSFESIINSFIIRPYFITPAPPSLFEFHLQPDFSIHHVLTWRHHFPPSWCLYLLQPHGHNAHEN